MASTKEIKNRIESVRDTKKITNAMYLISSTKLRKARRDLDATRPYFEALGTEIKRIFRTAEYVESLISTRLTTIRTRWTAPMPAWSSRQTRASPGRITRMSSKRRKRCATTTPIPFSTSSGSTAATISPSTKSRSNRASSTPPRTRRWTGRGRSARSC